MKMIQVSSSAFTHIGYNEARHVLRVKFNSGAMFEYNNVTAEDWEALNTSKSIGAYFMRSIKPSRDAIPVKDDRPKCKVNGVPVPCASEVAFVTLMEVGETVEIGSASTISFNLKKTKPSDCIVDDGVLSGDFYRITHKDGVLGLTKITSLNSLPGLWLGDIYKKI